MLMTEPSALVVARNRAAVMEELRRLMPGLEGLRTALPFGLAAVDSHLPEGGLACGALHEVVPDSEACRSAALGFIAAILTRLSSLPPQGRRKILFAVPAYGHRQHGRLSGHGLAALGFDPARLILVETAHRRETLWTIEEALRSGAPQAVAAVIDKLDLKSSQRLHLAATDAGLPLLLLRPAPPGRGEGWASAAATRWRVGTAKAARDRFGLITRPRWHLQLERCRNGRPGEWVVEYDHVAHRFSLAAALADPALSRRATEKSLRRAG
ncbi:MAG TPA: ImuA protein [Xanthobacteraceae bacterium]|nr:ImuA protein [Xanthobacteraceae bacterium]